MYKNKKIVLSIIGIGAILFLCLISVITWSFIQFRIPDSSKNTVARNCRDLTGNGAFNFFPTDYIGNWKMKVKDLPVKLPQSFTKLNNLTDESEIICKTIGTDEASIFVEKGYANDPRLNNLIFFKKDFSPNQKYKTSNGRYSSNNTPQRDYLSYEYFRVKIPETNSYLEITSSLNMGLSEVVSYKEFKTKDGQNFYIVLEETINSGLGTKLKEFFNKNVKDKFECFDNICSPKESELENIHNLYNKELMNSIDSELENLKSISNTQEEFLNEVEVIR